MTFMDLPGQLLSGKKVTISKRRKTVIERIWLDIRIGSLVTTMFFGWVAVITVLDFMRERAVYGGLYVSSHLVIILSNDFLRDFHDHHFHLSLNSAAALAVRRHYRLLQSLPSSCKPISLQRKGIAGSGHKPFMSEGLVLLRRAGGDLGMILRPACWACIA
jgi:hypothetical protein